MSVTKDGDTGRWMSQIRVTDWTGKTIHKKKRGFATKKEALQWERDFISQSTGSLGMTFGDFISLYVKDMEHRLKPSTVASKKWLIDLNNAFLQENPAERDQAYPCAPMAELHDQLPG